MVNFILHLKIYLGLNLSASSVLIVVSLATRKKRSSIFYLFSDMWFTNLCLLAPVSLIKAMPVIDTGVGSHVIGSEAQIRDFAIFTDNSLDNLPEPFTICSSIATKSFIGGLSPFQLLHDDGKPWISVNFEATDKSATFHHITITVSKKQFLSSSNLPLHFAHWQCPIKVREADPFKNG